VDWVALALLAYEVPSILFSQNRDNSIGATEVVTLSVLTYFAVRLVLSTPLRAACLAAALGLSGAWFAVIGIRQFTGGVSHLASVGLTDLVAFRALLIHPIFGWVAGENLTLLLLTLPFACAAGVYAVWRARMSKSWSKLAFLALLPAIPIVVVLLLSLSRAVFWSSFFFFAVACGLMAAYKVITIRGASYLLAGCCGTLLLILSCEAGLYPGIFRAYAGRHTSQTRSTQGRIDIWHRSLELVSAHPAWGVGSSNAALFLLSSADQHDTTGFARQLRDRFGVSWSILHERPIAQ
jgi:O-antigen ligase